MFRSIVCLDIFWPVLLADHSVGAKNARLNGTETVLSLTEIISDIFRAKKINPYFMSLTVSLCPFHFQVLCSVSQNPYYSRRRKSLARGIDWRKPEVRGPWKNKHGLYNPAAVKYTTNLA